MDLTATSILVILAGSLSVGVTVVAVVQAVRRRRDESAVRHRLRELVKAPDEQRAVPKELEPLKSLGDLPLNLYESDPDVRSATNTVLDDALERLPRDPPEPGTR